MELLFDCANTELIEKYLPVYPITGVTSNPSILKAEGKIDAFERLREIRKIIGPDRTLHAQVVAEDAKGMVEDAIAILNKVDENVYIKIPTTEEGLKAMQILKSQDVNVTATAIYTKIQGFMAIMAGADFIAPYCNRMCSLDVDFEDTISAFRDMIDENEADCTILAASFKNVDQVVRAYLAGAQAATVQPALISSAFQMAAVKKAVDDFEEDWVSTQGDVTWADLAKKQDRKRK